MTDDEERLRQHWQELAEQLGLVSGSEPIAVEKPTPKATGPASPAPPARAETSKEYSQGKERTFSPRDQTAPTSRPVSEESAPAAWQTEDQPEQGILEQSSGSEATETVRRPARRSDRGDRPRRSRASDTSRGRETAAEASSPAGETIEEKSAERSRRRRKGSSGRPREEEAADPSADLQPEEPPDAPESPEEADKDDLDTLTDWNVPSWTELIDTLYRPDR